MTKLTFSYNSGRGRLEIILDALLPCAAADFKRLLSFVELSDDPATHAETIYNYIAAAVDELKKERETHNPESVIGKKNISRINTAIKKHLSNAAPLSKAYGLPALEDADAKIIHRPAVVYALRTNDAGKPVLQSFNGWTFEKGGYTFDIYKTRKQHYSILLHGTGLQAATTTSRNDAAAEITPNTMEILGKITAEKMEQMHETYRQRMIEAGFMEDDKRPENISEPDAPEKPEEESTMTEYRFTKNTISISGTTYPAEYNIITTGSVLAFAILSVDTDGYKKKERIRFALDSPDYPAALAAALEGLADKQPGARRAEAERPENTPEATPAAESTPEIIYMDETGAPRDPKKARGPVPEKTFIGSAIQGRGWKILFDGSTGRTRVIFEDAPTDAARAAIENAGFYYSPNMNSWNKKLTFKSYRAAQILSGALNELYAA